MCLISGTCSAFLNNSTKVFARRGQSYANAASTIGTLSKLPADSVKAFTVHVSSVLSEIIYNPFQALSYWHVILAQCVGLYVKSRHFPELTPRQSMRIYEDSPESVKAYSPQRWKRDGDRVILSFEQQSLGLSLRWNGAFLLTMKLYHYLNL